MGIVAVISIHCPVSATFQYTDDSLVGIDTTPRPLWYVDGNRNLVSVRVFDDKVIGMYIAKNSIKAQRTANGRLMITGTVYEGTGQGYSPKNHVYLYGVDNAKNPVAIGDEESRVKNATRPLVVGAYAGWQTKGTARIAEMFFYMATGQKFYGTIPISDLPNTAAYQKAKNVTEYDAGLVYWYTQDVYDRCDGK